MMMYPASRRFYVVEGDPGELQHFFGYNDPDKRSKALGLERQLRTTLARAAILEAGHLGAGGQPPAS